MHSGEIRCKTAFPEGKTALFNVFYQLSRGKNCFNGKNAGTNNLFSEVFQRENYLDFSPAHNK